MWNKVLIFTVGAAVGSLVTWKIVEEKYKRIADEEIESVIEHFKNKEDKIQGMTCEEIEECGKAFVEGLEKGLNIESNLEITEEDKKKYEEVLNELAYTSEEEPEDFTKPYVISPEEFGEFGNETKSLMYYDDFVLATDDGEIISDPESLIGDALSHFGEFEDDCVHVRDENIECDYEILKSEKTFSEVYKGDD